MDKYGEVFTYPVGLEARFAVLRRNRKTGCWPIFVGPLLIVAAWMTLGGGTNWWIGPFVLVSIAVFMWLLERPISTVERATLELQDGFLSYDGRYLRQHDPTGTVVAEIDPRTPTSGSVLAAPKGWMLSVRQGPH
ncbi:MAG: hypothetical protein K2Q20_14390, partial [Phycisphaerales bacterium]|nr:hypothetical protein [Phycisphaerales bacterium]